MNKIITIGREFGSGGHEIGKLIAAHYNIPCYDKNLILEIIKNSTFCKEMLEEFDEKNNSLLYSIAIANTLMPFESYPDNLPLSQRVILAQTDTIKKLASAGPCVIVGRCADYTLKNDFDTFSIFITASQEFKIEEVKKRYDDIKSTKDALAMINKKNKERKSYYNFNTNGSWGRADNYDLCISSSAFGIENTAKTICEILDNFE